MICAEARRQLPAPDGAVSEAVAAHLRGCSPCRAEAEALQEIDRRLLRLAAHRNLSLPALAVQLDHHLIGTPLAPRPASPVQHGTAWVRYLLLALAILLAVATSVALDRHRHRNTPAGRSTKAASARTPPPSR